RRAAAHPPAGSPDAGICPATGRCHPGGPTRWQHDAAAPPGPAHRAPPRRGRPYGRPRRASSRLGRRRSMGTPSTSLRLTVIGLGYLGLTHAVCLAELGHEVLAIDVDQEKVHKAAGGEAPFFEPGLEPLLCKNIEAGRLHFTTVHQEVAEFGEVHFLCVGTP